MSLATIFGSMLGITLFLGWIIGDLRLIIKELKGIRKAIEKNNSNNY